MKKKTKTISGTKYFIYPNGVLIPVSYVKEKQTGPIKASKDCVPHFNNIRYEDQEHFAVLLLDAAHNVIDCIITSKGLLNSSMVHPRETFREAIKQNSESIIVAHNHPSGSLVASQSDKDTTVRLIESGKLLGISVLDHIIVSKKGWMSIRQEHPHYFI